MNRSSKFSNSEFSKQKAEEFLAAVSGEDVLRVLNNCNDFSVDENWKPYGGAEKNWDRIGNQTSEPVGALAELIINSIDAVLMRRAQEQGIDSNSHDVPIGMREAVKLFFPEVQEGKLSMLSSNQRINLAQKSVLIGVKRMKKRHEYPTYTIVDFGEGQNHDNFEQTFLSLGEKNKEGIPFVQGRFNMGSTGCLRFCTRSENGRGRYKFILSKRNLPDSDGLWGWTIIRLRKTRGSESLPVTEYFCPDGKIACFMSDKIRAFNNSEYGIVDAGSVVKLYEYAIGTNARRVDTGLDEALTTNLIDCALPLRLYDFDAKKTERHPRGVAIRTFSGMKIGIKTDDAVPDGLTIIGHKENTMIAGFGKIKISFFGFPKLPNPLKTHPNQSGASPYRIFFTINGQTQAKFRASKFRKMGLDDVRDNLIVQVDCNAMDNDARAEIFMPDRERMATCPLSTELEEIVVQSLKGDPDITAWAKKIREQRAKKTIADEEDKNYLTKLIKNSPELHELFGLGNLVDALTQTPGGYEKYTGERFPTFLMPTNLSKDGSKELPMDSYRIIKCKTDAANDYLSRDGDQGEFICPDATTLPNSDSLRNGRLSITISSPKDSTVGDKIKVKFGFHDNHQRLKPLMFDVNVEIVAKEEPASQSKLRSKTNIKKKNSPTHEFPDIIFMGKDDSYGFDDDSGGDVRGGGDGENLTIYVNRDNRHLLEMKRRERDSGERWLIEHRFKIGVGLLTLALYNKLVGGDDDDRPDYDGNEILRNASSAIAPLIVTLIEKLGGDKRLDSDK